MNKDSRSRGTNQESVGQESSIRLQKQKLGQGLSWKLPVSDDVSDIGVAESVRSGPRGTEGRLVMRFKLHLIRLYRLDHYSQFRENE